MTVQEKDYTSLGLPVKDQGILGKVMASVLIEPGSWNLS
jgi:hypothetical protein